MTYVLIDIEGAIVVRLELSASDAQEPVLAAAESMDLAGLAALLH